MKRHTNLDYEITGEYYPKKRDWTVTITTLITIAVIILLAEYLFGDSFTSWLRSY